MNKIAPSKPSIVVLSLGVVATLLYTKALSPEVTTPMLTMIIGYAVGKDENPPVAAPKIPKTEATIASSESSRPVAPIGKGNSQ
jgi:hypothetical protein